MQLNIHPGVSVISKTTAGVATTTKQQNNNNKHNKATTTKNKATSPLTVSGNEGLSPVGGFADGMLEQPLQDKKKI